MSPLIVLMLIGQLGLVAAAAYVVAIRDSASAAPRPGWSSIAIALVVGSLASFQIATAHAGEAGSVALELGAAGLAGMALMSALLALRVRRR
jgi:hypothetical protein